MAGRNCRPDICVCIRRLTPRHSGDGVGVVFVTFLFAFAAADRAHSALSRSREGLAVQKFPMTAEGLAKLEDELKVLKAEQRPAVIRAIAEARAHGDLSENAEYHAARERQSFIEGRIAELETIIPAVEVIDVSKLSGDQVKFGARVTVVDEETEEPKTYRIVGAYEADMKVNSISISSPLAKALIGKKVGDSVEVPAPGGARAYEITAVAFR
jgi:transcription elongation factor GreA